MGSDAWQTSDGVGAQEPHSRRRKHHQRRSAAWPCRPTRTRRTRCTTTSIPSGCGTEHIVDFQAGLRPAKDGDAAGVGISKEKPPCASHPLFLGRAKDTETHSTYPDGPYVDESIPRPCLRDRWTRGSHVDGARQHVESDGTSAPEPRPPAIASPCRSLQQQLPQLQDHN